MIGNRIGHGIVGIMVLAVLTVSGCTVAGLFLKDHDYEVKESWEVRTPPPNLFEAVADTGRSMNFDVDYWEMRNPHRGLEYWETKSPPPVDKNDVRFRSIIFSDNGLGGFKAAVLGKRKVRGLTFYAWQGGSYMEVYISVEGNLGSGTEKAAAKVLSDFRTKLSERIGEISVIRGTPKPAPAA